MRPEGERVDPIAMLERGRERTAWVEVDVAPAVMVRVREEGRSAPMAMVWIALPVAMVCAWIGVTSWGDAADPLLAMVRAAGGAP